MYTEFSLSPITELLLSTIFSHKHSSLRTSISVNDRLLSSLLEKFNQDIERKITVNKEFMKKEYFKLFTITPKNEDIKIMINKISNMNLFSTFA